MTTPSERFKSNLELASKLKLQANHWFSPDLADYVHHVSSYEQMDPECMCISLINIAATTCRKSFISRGSHFKVPLNIYNIIVARSGMYRAYCLYNDLFPLGYGKSTALSVAERGINAVATYFSSSFAEIVQGESANNEKKVVLILSLIKHKLEKLFCSRKSQRLFTMMDRLLAFYIN